eukprot:scaffold5011_cov255-Pinguiococcus_pyrenoidosus.AAC.2
MAMGTKGPFIPADKLLSDSSTAATSTSGSLPLAPRRLTHNRGFSRSGKRERNSVMSSCHTGPIRADACFELTPPDSLKR